MERDEIIPFSFGKLMFELHISPERVLRNTEQTVQQIALQVGYASVSSFCHSFVRFYGKAPQQFREQAGKEN